MGELAQNILLVLSGKGGVGKSSVAVQLALSYYARGLRVGLLDIDLCGPSVPRMLGLHASQVHQGEDGSWIPVFYRPPPPGASPGHEGGVKGGHLEVMSIGFLLASETDAVVWRGPKKNAMIKQFLNDVRWHSNLDILLIDTPPGTSDEHMSIVESLAGRAGGGRTGAVVVTTPQAVSVHDVQRELTFCSKLGLPVLGLIENMCGFLCSNCSHCTYLFSQGGGKSLAARKEVPFLGSIPVDTNLAYSLDKGENFLEQHQSSAAVQFIQQIIANLEPSLHPENSAENTAAPQENSACPPTVENGEVTTG